MASSFFMIVRAVYKKLPRFCSFLWNKYLVLLTWLKCLTLAQGILKPSFHFAFNFNSPTLGPFLGKLRVWPVHTAFLPSTAVDLARLRNPMFAVWARWVRMERHAVHMIIIDLRGRIIELLHVSSPDGSHLTCVCWKACQTVQSIQCTRDVCMITIRRSAKNWKISQESRFNQLIKSNRL